MNVTDDDVLFWLDQFSDMEIAAIATEFVGWYVSPSIVASHRAVRCNGSHAAA